MPGTKARSLFQARDGSLWFGTEYDGVLRVEPLPTGGPYPAELQGRVFTDANGLAHNEVKAMLQDVDGNLWLATHDGITRIAAEALARLAGIEED
jgi:ligand-binding sensor domain-containing protein